MAKNTGTPAFLSYNGLLAITNTYKKSQIQDILQKNPNQTQNTVLTVKYRGGLLMFWGCFATSGTRCLDRMHGIIKI